MAASPVIATCFVALACGCGPSVRGAEATGNVGDTGGAGGAGGGAGGGRPAWLGTLSVDSRSGRFASYDARARFRALSDNGSPCPSEEIGSCLVIRCGDAESRATREPRPEAPDPIPGALLLSYEGIREPLELDEYGSYSTSGDGPLWSTGGAPVTIAATAGGVPAFSISAPAPGYIDVSAPVFPKDPLLGPMHIPTAAELALAWSGGQPGSQMLAFVADQSYSVMMSCRLPVEARAGTIPVHPFEGVYFGLLVITVESSARQAVGDGELALTVSSLGSTRSCPFGSANFLVVFE